MIAEWKLLIKVYGLTWVRLPFCMLSIHSWWHIIDEGNIFRVCEHCGKRQIIIGCDKWKNYER